MDSNLDLHLTLASGSPRRSDLLALTGWPFTAIRSTAEEIARDEEDPTSMTKRLARAKAWAVAERASDHPVLAADTLVIDQGLPLGKPSNQEEAQTMLMSLRGHQHSVVTSIALVDIAAGREVMETCVSRVPMRLYDEGEVQAYVAAGSPMDKAGAYGIQDHGFDPVDMSRMEDCYANVMGLPLCHVVRGMETLGHGAMADVPVACRAHTGYDCRISAEILGTDL